ncbi:unnamed protein product [Dicrocoelium dendriticum]|nr:unnamed protein product [Dicrocoelium dendriticum]
MPEERFDSGAEENVPVWLTVRAGYKSALLLKYTSDDRCLILLLPEKEKLEVDAMDLERANPPAFDRIEDLAGLRFINECSVTHVLIQRFGSGQFFTYASGGNLIAINPMYAADICTSPVMNLFTNSKPLRELPAHVFSVAQLVLARLHHSVLQQLSSRQKLQSRALEPKYRCSPSLCQQAVCFTGRSGAGKTHTCLDLLSYFVHQSNQMSVSIPYIDPPHIRPQRITVERIRAMFMILDAFTCSRILSNANASRAIRLFSLEWTNVASWKDDSACPSSINPKLVLSGLTTRLLLFDRIRVSDRRDNEPNFNIFYYFLSGLDDHTKEELLMTNLDEKNLFLTRLKRTEDREAAACHWRQLCKCAELLEFGNQDEWLTGGIARMLAIIYHLGCAGCVSAHSSPGVSSPDRAETLNEGRSGFRNLSSARTAARLLGCSIECLHVAVFESTGELHLTPLDRLRGFAQDLYQVTVDMVVALINRCLSSDFSTAQSRTGDIPSPVCAQIFVCDPFGLQAPALGARKASSQTPASLFDLVVNYTNDRLGHLFYETNIGLNRARTYEEGISATSMNNSLHTTGNLVALLDELSPSKCTLDPGIFWHIEAACLTGDLGVVKQKLEEAYQLNRIKHRDLRTIRRFRRTGTFVLNHSLSSFPVEYSLDVRWLVHCRMNTATAGVNVLLHRSSVPSIKHLLFQATHGRDFLQEVVPKWLSGTSHLRLVKQQMDFLIQLLRSCAFGHPGPQPRESGKDFNDGGSRNGLHWVHCLLPVNNAVLYQLNPHRDRHEHNGQRSHLTQSPVRICVNLIRAQLRGLNLITILRGARNASLGAPQIERPSEDISDTKEVSKETGIQVIFRCAAHIQSMRKEESINKWTRVVSSKRCLLIQALIWSVRFSSQACVIGARQLFLRNHTLAQLDVQSECQQPCSFIDHRDHHDRIQASCMDYLVCACVDAPAQISGCGSEAQPKLDAERRSLSGAQTLEGRGDVAFALSVLVQEEDRLLQTQLFTNESRNTVYTLTQSPSITQSEHAVQPNAPSSRNELNGLRKQRGDFLAQLGDLRSEVNNVKHNASITEQTRRKLEWKLDKVQTDSRKALDERDADLEGLRTTHHEHIRQLEQQLGDAQAESAKENRDRLQMQHDFSTLSAELKATAYDDAERKLCKEVKRLKNLLTEKEALLEHVLQQPHTDRSHINQLRYRIDEADETNATLNRQRRALQVELDDALNQLSISNRSRKEVGEPIRLAS